MGRSKRKKTQNPILSSETMKSDSKPSNVSVDQILDEAEENVDSFNYEAAQKFCQRAVELEPDNLRALEMIASLSLETGDIEEAKKCLDRAVQLCPDSGYRKYLSMGEIHTGNEAINYYGKGIEILLKEVEAETQISAAKENDESLTRSLSTAYCSVGELYMTDCCFEENAEELCLSYIEKAILSDPTNPEAYQLKASYLLVKEEFPTARETMDKSLSLWLPQYQAVREGQVDTSDGVEVCPISYVSRINAVKILIELEAFEEAACILNGLVEEDDEVVESWYLLGWMNNLRGEDFHGNARFYLKQCKMVASKIGFDDDKELLAHVEELLDTLGPDEDEENKENEDDDEDDDDDNVDDAESSEEEMEQ